MLSELSIIVFSLGVVMTTIALLLSLFSKTKKWWILLTLLVAILGCSYLSVVLLLGQARPAIGLPAWSLDLSEKVTVEGAYIHPESGEAYLLVVTATDPTPKFIVFPADSNFTEKLFQAMEEQGKATGQHPGTATFGFQMDVEAQDFETATMPVFPPKQPQ